MSPLLALRVVTYCLVGAGLAALLLAGLIGLPGAALVAGAILASWWLEGARERGQVRPAVIWVLLGTAAVAIAVDFFYLASSVLDGMVHLLLFLILLRLFTRRRLRDLRDAGYLSFFLLIAASSVTFSVGFLFVFAAFALLGTWVLMLHHVVAESERAGRPAVEAAAGDLAWGNPLVRMSLAAAAAGFVLAGIFFFVIPRVGQAALPFRAPLGRMVTGFSDRVELGAYGDIETDSTVVMRVYLPGFGGDPSQLPNLRWRGIVYERFDGHQWVAGQVRRISLRRSPAGDFALSRPQGRGLILRQEVYLDPIGTEVVFGAPRVLRMELRAGTVVFDDTGSVSVPAASARLHYIVESELEPILPRGTPVTGAGVGFAPQERARFLQLPAVSPGITRLARDITGGSRDPYEAALRLTEYLQTRYKYTLALKRETQLEPLEEFLFIRRSGNCEYFAAALAVMLRSLEIPARVVGGFQRGEWNAYGGYFMVRLADAHSWVEAYFDGVGWVTLDPSPRAPFAAVATPGLLLQYLDAARMRWYRYIINWSLQDQVLVAATVQRQAGDLHLSMAWAKASRPKPWLIGMGAGAVLAVLVWALWRGVRPAAGARATARIPRFYARTLRALAKRGFRPEPAETARQFGGRVSDAVPAWAEPVASLTLAYERTRFGAVEPRPDELAEIERTLAALEHS